VSYTVHVVPNYYAQATLASQTGETADVNVNIFSFIGPAVFDSTAGEFVGDAIKQFYVDVRTAGGIKGMAQNGHTIKMYSATTLPPNYPIDEYAFNLPVAPGAIEMPLEVALCVSYANDSATIVPRARRRGRIYISGWGESDNTSGRPVSTAYGGLVTAYETYADTLNADPDYEAGVWSRTNGIIYPIERIWADNEWDTQRSRGGKSTARTTVTL